MQLQILSLKEEVDNLKMCGIRTGSGYSSAVTSRPWPLVNMDNSHRPVASSMLASRHLRDGSTSYFLSPKNHPVRVQLPASRSSSTRCQGYRILWGTKLNTDISLIKDKLTACLKVEDRPNFVVKKTTKQNRNGRTNWWFTIIASESIISELVASWPSFNKPRLWSLCCSLKKCPRALVPCILVVTHLVHFSDLLSQI